MALRVRDFCKLQARHKQTNGLGFSALLEPMWLETGRIGFLTSSLFCRVVIGHSGLPGARMGGLLRYQGQVPLTRPDILGDEAHLLSQTGSLGAVAPSYTASLSSFFLHSQSQSQMQMLNRCWLTQRSLFRVSESLVTGFLGIFLLPSPGWDPCVMMTFLLTPAGVDLKLRSHSSYHPCAQLSDQPDGHAGVPMLFNFTPTLFFSPELEGLISAHACMV